MKVLEKGIIYKITCQKSNKYYIGSTSNKLNNRIAQHKQQYKYFLSGMHNNYLSSFEIIKENNYSVEILEQINYKYRVELLEKEREYIMENNNNILCVNIQIPNNSYKTHLKKHTTSNKIITYDAIINNFKNSKYHTKMNLLKYFKIL